MRCELCKNGEERFCEECTLRLDDDQHPVICMGCRDKFGAHASLTWISRHDLDGETCRMLTVMEGTAGVAMFVRGECSTCKEIENETIIDLLGARIGLFNCDLGMPSA